MSSENTPGETRCGYVALIGAPNAGKSTLLNALVGQKLSIVTHKRQTTRARVLGILCEGAAQIIFVDTPGIFAPEKRLDRAMVHAAWAGASDADIVLLLADVSKGRLTRETEGIIERLREADRKVMLVLNKIDLVRPQALLPLLDALNGDDLFTDVWMISAEKGEGLARMMEAITSRLPRGPWLYPEDQATDIPMRNLAAEITREQLFLRLHEELPYASTVETEAWERFDDGSVKISQVVFVERDSQKGIVLGKQGRKIREIGEAARLELEQMMQSRVHLKLFVKVREGWGDDPERYRPWGLEFDA